MASRHIPHRWHGHGIQGQRLKKRNRSHTHTRPSTHARARPISCPTKQHADPPRPSERRASAADGRQPIEACAGMTFLALLISSTRRCRGAAWATSAAPCSPPAIAGWAWAASATPPSTSSRCGSNPRCSFQCSRGGKGHLEPVARGARRQGGIEARRGAESCHWCPARRAGGTSEPPPSSKSISKSELVGLVRARTPRERRPPSSPRWRLDAAVAQRGLRRAARRRRRRRRASPRRAGSLGGGGGARPLGHRRRLRRHQVDGGGGGQD